MKFYRCVNFCDWSLAFHTRTHSPDVLIGLLKSCRNGVQVCVGPLAISVSWPIGLHKWVVGAVRRVA